MLAIDFLDRLCRCSCRTLWQRNVVAAMERESIELLDLRLYRYPGSFTSHTLCISQTGHYLNDLQTYAFFLQIIYSVFVFSSGQVCKIKLPLWVQAVQLFLGMLTRRHCQVLQILATYIRCYTIPNTKGGTFKPSYYIAQRYFLHLPSRLGCLLKQLSYCMDPVRPSWHTDSTV